MKCRFNNSGFCLLETGKRCTPEGCTRLEHGERVHVYSWPIARAFTFSELCDYLNSHKEDSSAAIAEFGGWKFNVHGVCLNRKIAVKEYIGRTGGEFRVEVYQAPKGHVLGAPLAWYFDADYSDGRVGGTAGFGEVDGDETDAIIAGLERVIMSFEKSRKWYGDRQGERQEVCRAGERMAREEIDKRRELTLF